ncbi:DNRLRE domain-containing protein [Streptomyces sp. NPDC048349]|uniref:DNRLRE domain-containing protein n=1 Tax=Streptomyces sp. NPDC048349 TaxID=3155486 RepID=UPI00343A86FC
MRLTAALTAAVLGACLLTAAEGDARAAVSPPSTPAPDGAVQDAPSALLAARLRGKPVEVEGVRSETATTWANPDGTLTTEVGLGPVRVKRGGTWVPIDTTLVRSPDGMIRPKASTADIEFAGGAPNGKATGAGPLGADAAAPEQSLATVGDEGKAVALGWKGELPEPVLEGSKATYRDVRPGVDLVLESMPTGIEYFVVVKNRSAVDASGKIVLPVDTQGLTARNGQDGGIDFVDESGEVKGRMPAAVMWDSERDPVTAEQVRRAPVGMTWKPNLDGGVTVELTPDAALMRDPKAKFPITIDPVIEWGLSFDTFVQQGTEWNKDNSDSTDLKIGNNGQGQIARTFMFFKLPSDLWGKQIRNARVFMNNYHSATCTPQPWEMYVSGVPDRTSRWSNQPALYSLAASGDMTRDKDTGDAHQCDADNAWISATVTGTVQTVMDQRWTTLSLGMKAVNETNVNGWKRFYSGNTSAYPKMNIVWNSYPDVTDLHVGPAGSVGTGTPGNPQYTSSVRPSATFTVNDADGGLVQPIVEVAKDGQFLRQFVLGYVPAGSQQSWQVPEGLFEEGHLYGIRVNVADGNTWARQWTGWYDSIPDVTRPSAPGVGSADYPTGSWVKGAGQVGTFTITPPAGEQVGVEWTLNGTDWTRVATGGSTNPVAVQITPDKNGTHALQVRTVDRADNKSEAVVHSFHVGAGGFLTPAPGDRTARHVPLAAEADAGRFDRATFMWRRSDADPWVEVPTNHVRVNGQPLGSWPVALTGGRNAPAVWDAVETVDPGGEIQLRTDFRGPGGASDSSETIRILVDRYARGAAAAEVGPGSVNLLTGEYSMTTTDLSVFEVEVSRHSSSLRPATGLEADQVPIFGKEWAAGTVADVGQSHFSHIEQVSENALDVVDLEGEAIHFTADASRTGWVAQMGEEGATLVGSLTGELKLVTDYGSVITFAKVAPDAETWRVKRIMREGIGDSGTTVVSESVTVDGKQMARPVRIIAPTSAVSAATCEVDVAARGCRVVEFVYASATTATGSAFGDVAGQVSGLRVWATAPGAQTSTPTTLIRYAYDAAGRLREVWDPRVSPALKTGYQYDAAGRVTQTAVPGELPYTLVYGPARPGALDGMLLAVSRPTLQQGSIDQPAGTNVTSLVYGVPLSGTSSPYPMGSGDVAAWGQADAPAEATAVFAGDVVPSSHDGSALAPSAYARATVQYLNARGQLVNMAYPGGGISTAQYDRHQNNTWALTAANRALALGVTDGHEEMLTKLGMLALSPAERANHLATRKVYSADGVRELEQIGPLRVVRVAAAVTDGQEPVVAAGGLVVAHPVTVTQYDQNRPTDGSAVIRDQPTTVTSGARPYTHPQLLADPAVTVTAYDWPLGAATKIVLDPGGLALTKVLEYDASGRLTRTRMPSSNGTDAGTTVTAYYSAGGSGPCGNRPEWADLACSVGPAGPITGGGGNPGELATKTTEYGQFGEVVKLTETANGSTVTTVTTLDGAGRAIKRAVTGGLGEPLPDVVTEYDPASGKIAKVSSASGAIATAYDRLGRLVRYTDAGSGTTTTEYDALDRVVKTSDSVPSTRTYTYDTVKEPRGMATEVRDSAAGTFSASYDLDGVLSEERLPGGITMRQVKDAHAVAGARIYTRDADGAVLLSDRADFSAQGRVASQHSVAGAASSQFFQYDGVGRLVGVDDIGNGVCTRRAYSFDRNTNRTAQSSATGLADGLCPATGGTTTAHSYDSADRLVDPGYTYDGFGRTTTLPGGSSLDYYANDRVHRQTAGNQRQTWQLDPTNRITSATTETNSAGTWSATTTTVHHYADGSDRPSWTVENGQGGLTRYVGSLGGGLAATTSAAGDTVLQLTDLHGDVAVQLPLDPAQAPAVLNHDEFGNPAPGQPAARYGWLGAAQRSTQTPTGLTLMGARLYDPGTGRFLSTDPVMGGGANAYVYCSGDAVNCTDTEGTLDYAFSFNLGFSLVSKETIFMLFRWNFGRIFPLKGRADAIYYGEEGKFMPLRADYKGYGTKKSLWINNFNVRVGYVGAWSLRLDAAPGSFAYGRNSWISFSLTQGGVIGGQPGKGFLTLWVQGHTAGDSDADRYMNKRIYKDGAYATWSRLASNWRKFLRKCRCY